LINGDFLTTNDCSNLSILYGIPSMQKFLQQVWFWNCLMNNKQASKTSSFCPLSLFGFHFNPLKHFWNLFCFNRCLLLNYFGRWISLLHLFLTLAPHHVLELELGKYINKYVKIINLYIKKSSFNRYWWKFCQLFNFNSKFSLFFFLCSSSFNLFFFLIIINNDKCRCR
jgi:hypothetical protein